VPFIFFIAHTTAKEVTNWQDRIISLKNVKKNWPGKKRKQKKDRAGWKKILCSQTKRPLSR